MKNDKADIVNVGSAVVAAKAEFPVLNENLLKSRIYTIRGVKVMLDADLAEIYGYSTKAFNQQVKNNIERFAEDFRFQLSKREVGELRSKILTAITDASRTDALQCKNCTANISTMSRSNPFVFTEQGIYMLMTVLKGDLAVQQSMALIRLFKRLKDYAASEGLFANGLEIAPLAVQTAQNTREIAAVSADVKVLSGEIHDIRDDLGKINMDLRKVMTNFIDPSAHRHFLILNGQKLEADVAYTQIYGMAKKSVMVVDNYVDVKTLDLLRCVAKGVRITIVSDQYGQTRLTKSMQDDFKATRPDVVLDDLVAAGNMFHDRYIYLDYGTLDEKLFHCGASSKDAGNKITTIMQVECSEVYHALIESLVKKQYVRNPY